MFSKVVMHFYKNNQRPTNLSVMHNWQSAIMGCIFAVAGSIDQHWQAV